MPTPDSHPQRCIIIGGGAAGFFAAIHAKTLNPELDVQIIEAARKPLGKVKISGGGRCNVTHACFERSALVQFYPRGKKELQGVFSRWMPQDTVSWFEAHGVPLKTEDDGRIFPTSNLSQSIIDCLMSEISRLGIKLHLEDPVLSLTHQEQGSPCFRIKTTKAHHQADAVLIATGSTPKSYQWLTALGHTIIPPVPSLFTFQCKSPQLEGLSGISFLKVKGSLHLGKERITQEGPLLITHWGLSGPVVLRLSAWGARALHAADYQETLILDLCPQLKEAELIAKFEQTKKEHPTGLLSNHCPIDLPKRYWQKLIELEIPDVSLQWANIPKKALHFLVNRIKQASFQITGKGEFKDEFVTAGGVALSEINMSRMESKKVPRLFLAGEVIDVDGLTGGFNFQNAWATGWLAGESMANLQR